MNLTRFGEAEAVDSLREVVHANILGFAAILEKFLCSKKQLVRIRATTVEEPTPVTTHTRHWLMKLVDY